MFYLLPHLLSQDVVFMEDYIIEDINKAELATPTSKKEDMVLILFLLIIMHHWLLIMFQQKIKVHI